jgi:outer membrane lipoprotein-sorting protein
VTTRRTCCLVLLVLLLGGCAGKLPRTSPLAGAEQDEARTRLEQFLDRHCANAVDGDVEVGWQAYGRRENYAATLQAVKPASFRFAVVDPLGRPQLLLVSDGRTFTLADNRRAEGFTGSTASAYLAKYLPPGVARDDVFSWLSGRLDPTGLGTPTMETADRGGEFWYTFRKKSMNQTLVLTREGLVRRILRDGNDKVLLDVRYSDYQRTPDGCTWPSTLRVTGRDLPAEFTLRFTKIYSQKPPAASTFLLRLPPHFTVHQVR